MIPAGSRLLELADIQRLVGAFDEAALYYPWRHPDPRVDRLHAAVLAVVQAGQAERASRRDVFTQVWGLVHRALGVAVPAVPERTGSRPPVPIPYVSEPWFC